MPSVIGLDFPDALAAMVQAGVRVPLGYFQTDPVSLAWAQSAAKPGFVLAQNPAAGATMAANATATLTVASFPMSVANYGGVGS